MRTEITTLSVEQIKNRTKALENETSSYKSEINRLKKEMSNMILK